MPQRIQSEEIQTLDCYSGCCSRQLCVLLSAEDIYRALARILLAEKNLKFVATMVDVLNSMLLTAGELFELRRQLRTTADPVTRICLRIVCIILL